MRSYTKANPSGEVTPRERENRILAYEAACESIVLLRNDGCLPLQSRTIALYGPGAVKTVKGGTGSGEVNERHAVTVLEGLRERGFQVTTERWLNDYDRDFDRALADHRQERKKQVRLWQPKSIMNMLFDNFPIPVGRAITAEDVAESSADTCVYVLSRQAGEGGDRKASPGDYYLTGEEQTAISFCAGHYPHFVLVINSGSPVDTGFLEEIEGINAVIYLCQPGSEGGHALADVLSGAVTPSGKLADTWPRRYEDIPFAMEYSSLNGELEQEYYREGIYVGYRYFDTFGVEPAFPFGFGLSYTDFSIGLIDFTVDQTAVQLRVRVTNTGAEHAGRQTVQCYLSAPAGTPDKEHQSLATFGKTGLLAPGETQELTLSVDLRSMGSYRESDRSYVLDGGDYLLRLGDSSRSTVPAGIVRLPREVVLSRHEAICPCTQTLEELSAPERPEEALPEGLPRVEMDPDAFETPVCGYTPPEHCGDDRAEAFAAGLSEPEMVDIVVGIGMFGGEKRFDLPGSVGNTTSRFWDRGLANIALCDGPAGLRIQRRSALNKNGTIKPLEFPLSIFNFFPNAVKKRMLGDPDSDTLLYQYATAFPVAAALAQSWNTELLERVGEGIRREMAEYGCTFWLAPAVNLHRNPLCGRHFEYFSEDPRLAGAMAAAITRGIQAEEGFYVTVKHFACNNQEDNRNFVSSNVSERALRELYLKPFEMAVREGGAKGIMTSYNRVNSVYTPNSYDLCTKVLRNEWGFDGVVMTDWFSTGGRKASAALAIRAGNDLIMPGSGGDKKAILRGLKKGVLTREELRLSCARVVKAALHSATQKEYIDSQT